MNHEATHNYSELGTCRVCGRACVYVCLCTYLLVHIYYQFIVPNFHVSLWNDGNVRGRQK